MRIISAFVLAIVFLGVSYYTHESNPLLSWILLVVGILFLAYLYKCRPRRASEENLQRVMKDILFDIRGKRVEGNTIHVKFPDPPQRE